ncbi:MAG: lysylphosphatidylglycerol synthase transmembrane domain-containing protein [Balneolaceae bacterium]|nr:lysylphosphatidylglycerol synthase transmembrane domain-containing protein [Balneolaceae bacterium]
MLRKSIKIALTLLLGGLFLWLAFRNVPLREVWDYARQITFYWVPPFGLTLLTGHFLRAERWRLLIEHDKKELNRSTLVAGVLTGYLLNIVGPRLGEVSRPVYVAKREGLSASKLMGTIVLERIIDMATMLLLLLVVCIYLITDLELLRQIFGEQTVRMFSGGFALTELLWIVGLLLLFGLGGWAGWSLLCYLGRRFESVRPWVDRIRNAVRMFRDGILAARQVKRWGLFLSYTLLIWACYTAMSWIPFWMFDMQTVYDLSLLDALVVTVISAIGIAIPSPGGIGTYHYFVKQTLLVLFAVPAVTGLAYATITHAATVLFVALFTPLSLAVDKYVATREGKPVN